MTHIRGIRWVLAPVLVGFVAVTGAACSSSNNGSAAPATTSVESESPTTSTAETGTASAPADCADAGAPLADLTEFPGDALSISVPVPDGWERNTSMDSQTVRGALTSVALVKDAFAPNVTIVVEDLTGKVATAEDGVAAEVASLDSAGATVKDQTTIEICGFPAALVDATLAPVGAAPSRDGQLMVVVADTGSEITAVVLTAQTTDSTDPAYRDGVATIFAGAQITPLGQTG